MSTLLGLGLANAVFAGVLALLAYLVGRFSRRPALAHALWLLVFLKLLTPPLLRPGLAWLPAAESEAMRETARAEQKAVVAERIEVVRLAQGPLLIEEGSVWNRADSKGKPALDAKLLVPVPVVANVPESASTATSVQTPALLEKTVSEKPEVVGEVSETAGEPGWVEFLLVVWVGGAVVCLSRAVYHVVSFQRLLVHARWAPEEVQLQGKELARRMGIRQCPAVWLVPGPVPPMVWGVWRVRILYPAGLVERLSAEERGSLLAHELAHVYRWDHWVRLLELAALTIFWWYPLVWWAKGQLHAREEECCDGWATAVVSPRVYASAILEAVDFLAEARPRLPVMASGLAGFQALKERLTLIMTRPVSGSLAGPTRMAVVGLASAVLPLLPTLVQADRPSELAATVEAAQIESEPTEFTQTGLDLLGTPDQVNSVAFDEEGKQLAVGYGSENRPGEVELFNVATRKSMWRSIELRGVASVAFSPKEQRLAWSGWKGQLRVRDLSRGKLTLSLNLGEQITRLSYSSDGKWLATATEGNRLRLHEPSTGKVLQSLSGDLMNVYCVSFSPDSQLLGAGGGYLQGGEGRKNQALIFDVSTRKPIARLEGHSRAVLGLAFAPRNEMIATAGADNTVRVWDGKSFKLRNVLIGHTNPIKGVAFSPDSKLLATGSWDGTVRLWDPRAGKQVAQLEASGGAVRDVAFSPDGKMLVSGGDRQTVKLWDILTRREIATLRQARSQEGRVRLVVGMALSPDGSMMAIGEEGGTLQLREMESGQIRWTIKGHEDAITAISFSRDGRQVATSGPDAQVKVWETASGKQLHHFDGHKNWVYALVFSPDGKTLASGSYDRTIRLWSLAGGEVKELKGHRGSIRALVFSGDGKRLYSGGADRTIRVWEVATLKNKEILKGHEGAVRVLVLSEARKRLISAGEDGILKQWDLETLKEGGKVKSPYDGPVQAMAMSPGEQTLAVGNENGAVWLYDVGTMEVRRTQSGVHREGVLGLAFGGGGKQMYSLGGEGVLQLWQGAVGPVRMLSGHRGPVRVAIFSPDGKRVLSCGGWPEGDKTLRLWDVGSGKELRTLVTAKMNLQSAVFSRDGKWAIGGCDNGVISLWEVESGKLVRELKGHRNGIPHLTVSREGKYLLSSGHDQTVRLWDLETGEAVKIYRGHTDWVRVAAFHPDGKRIVTGGRDRKVRIWDLESGKQLSEFEHRGAWVESLVISPDGKQVLTAGGNEVHRWELDTGKHVRTYSGHPFGVTSLALTRDGKRVFSSSYDGSIRIWDVETGAEVERLTGHRNWVWSVCLSPDEKQLLSAGGGGQVQGKWVAGEDFTIRLWRVPPKVVARAK